MAAGLPGFGLSGAFFIVSALLMVPIEIVRTLQGRSTLARWTAVLRNAGIALAILAGVELAYVALHLAVTGISGSATLTALTRIPVLSFLGTLTLVALVIASGKVAETLSYLRQPAIQRRAESATWHQDVGSLGNDGPRLCPASRARPAVKHPSPAGISIHGSRSVVEPAGVRAAEPSRSELRRA